MLSTLAETRLELEQGASVIRCYEPQFIPELLQTTDYARAVLELNHPGASAFEVNRRLGLLTRRQRALHRPDPSRLWAVVDEAALRRRIGAPATMRQQLRRLIEVAELPHVTIQVMTFVTGVAAGGAITFLRFAERELSDVVYLDQIGGALYLDKKADVQHYGQVVDRLSTKAQPPAKTPVILRRLRREA